MQSNGGVFNVETIKGNLGRNTGIIVAIVICIVLCICIGCYLAGRESAERDADIRRVQSTQQQLDDATEQLDEATRTNNTARDTAQRSEQLNESIRYSVDSSADAVAKSKAANARTSAELSEAKQLVADAKRTAEQNSSIIANSESILERAITRNQRTAIEAEKK